MRLRVLNVALAFQLIVPCMAHDAERISNAAVEFMDETRR